MSSLRSADAMLVVRCQEDDFDAFDEIIARYKDGIYNYIWRMVSNRDDTEDLSQEVFVRVFTGIKSFRRESNLRTWLYRIATNLCVDKYRRARTEKHRLAPLEHQQDENSDSPGPLELADSTYDPQRICERTELQATVQAALWKLPDKLRSAILMHDMEGMSYEEIAEVLGCPVGTVKSRIYNARMQLHRRLEPYVVGTE